MYMWNLEQKIRNETCLDECQGPHIFLLISHPWNDSMDLKLAEKTGAVSELQIERENS